MTVNGNHVNGDAVNGTAVNGTTDDDARFESVMASLHSAKKETHEAQTPQQKALGQHKLSRAAGELKSLVDLPQHFAWNVMFWSFWPSVIAMASEIGILPAINSRKGEPVTAATLAKELHYDEDLIVRIMRFITSEGVAQEVDQCTYKSTPRSEFLSTPGMIGGLKFNQQLFQQVRTNAISYMPHAGSTADTSDSQALPPINPFKAATGGDDFWPYLKKTPDMHRSFDAFMQGRRVLFPLHWFDVYPAAEKLFPTEASQRGDEDVVMVDVGGGRGHDTVALKEAFPDQRGRYIVQDLPETLEGLTKDNLKGVEPMVVNIFDGEPIKGASTYYLRQVLHFWSDTVCRQVLHNLAIAMDPLKSTLLLDDVVIKDRDAHHATVTHDMVMLHLFGMKERTEKQWRSVIDGVEPKLEVVQIWGLERTDRDTVIIEIRRVRE